MGPFDAFASRFGRNRPEAAAIARVKAMAAVALGLSKEASVVVNEIVCADPACPGTETVVLVMEPGRRTRALKVGKPADEVGAADIVAAAAATPEPG